MILASKEVSRMQVNGRVFFQTRIDKDLLQRFREIQEVQGRTSRSMVEEFMYNKIDEYKRKLRGNDGSGQLQQPAIV